MVRPGEWVGVSQGVSVPRTLDGRICPDGSTIYHVGLRFNASAGRYLVAHLSVSPLRPVRASYLFKPLSASLAVAACLREEVLIALDGIVVSWQQFVESARSRSSSVRSRRQTVDSLRWVARVYVVSRALNGNVFEDVAATFGLPHATASRRIAEAKSAGLIAAVTS